MEKIAFMTILLSLKKNQFGVQDPEFKDSINGSLESPGPEFPSIFTILQPPPLVIPGFSIL
jgi:hypothetical protein